MESVPCPRRVPCRQRHPKASRCGRQSPRLGSCRPDSTRRCTHRQCVPASWTTVYLWRDSSQQYARATSQSFNVLSVQQPEARVFPSGLHAMLRTSPVCPSMLTSILPVAASQSFSVASPALEARVFPFGLQATLQIASVWPGKSASILPVAASQSFIVRSSEPVARIFPFGCHANAVEISSVFLQADPRLALVAVRALHRLVARSCGRDHSARSSSLVFFQTNPSVNHVHEDSADRRGEG